MLRTPARLVLLPLLTALAAPVATARADLPPPPTDSLMRRSGPIVTRDASGRLVVADHPGLRNPSEAREQAPEVFRARLVTTRGPVVIEVTRAWAPRGADRFWNLVRIGYFNDVAIFRVIPGFMAQFGIHGDPEIAAVWREARLSDDVVQQSNLRGYVSFATAGPNTRTTQMFFNYGNNRRLDGMGFAPFGRVVAGMDLVDRLYSDYGEGAPNGKGPDQGRIQSRGNEYLRAEFGALDYIVEAEIIDAATTDDGGKVDNKPDAPGPKGPSDKADAALDAAPGTAPSDAETIKTWLRTRTEASAAGKAERVRLPLVRIEADLGAGRWGIAASADAKVVVPLRVVDLTSAGIASGPAFIEADGVLRKDPTSGELSLEIVRARAVSPDVSGLMRFVVVAR